MAEYSSKIHQEKGLHVEILGKFVITFAEFQLVRNAYLGGSQKNESSGPSNNMLGVDSFYSNLERFIMKTDPMGLLIWENPYSVLDERWSPISSLPYPAYKVIIAPPSRSLTNPEFESIHSITNYLLKTF